MENVVYRKALPIEVVLKAIYNQYTTMAEAGMVPKKVQKGFFCCFHLQKLIIIIFYVENVPDPTQIQKCHVKNLKCYKKHTPGQKKISKLW